MLNIEEMSEIILNDHTAQWSSAIKRFEGVKLMVLAEIS